ncbi:MAG: hypothetical protein K5891_07335 [Lachnospiraceae bacterium]|nr:hypothetical protein [Lachnospiraceae bacterium]
MKIGNTTNTGGIHPRNTGAVDSILFGNRKGAISFGGSRFGGKTALTPLEEKTQEARKKAMKLVSDAFSGVKEADKMMDDQRGRFKELSDKVSELSSQIRSMEEHPLPEEATEEERDAYNDSLKEYRKQVKDAKAEMQGIDQALRSSRIERLKSDPVGDAFDQADKIMEAAGEAVLGEAASDAMDHIQEDLEEKQEQAEKFKEEKEELEERIEKAKEKKEEREELTEEILESTTSEKVSGMTVTEAQDQVKNMLNKLGLIEEEIKGAAIDELK